MDTAERARTLDRRLTAARKRHRQAEHTLAVLLAEMADAQLHRALGYASVIQYARAALDLAPRQARDLVRIGRKLPHLPVLNAALAAGELDWTKAREIVTVATPATEASWVERAKAVSCRSLEAAVSASRAGDPPPEAPEVRAPARVRLVFEVESADAERIRLAIAAVRASTGLDAAEVEDGAILAALVEGGLRGDRGIAGSAPAVDAESTRAGPGEPLPGDRASVSSERPTWGADAGEPYRFVVEHCPSCGADSSRTCEVSDTIAAEARCDAEVIDMRPGATRGEAKRTIPEATRRAVLHRDGWACAVPTCRNRLWLHLHHVHPFAKGGRHAEWNLVSLCSVHHRAVHDGRFALEVDARGAVVVEHGDGRRHVSAPHVGRLPPRAEGGTRDLGASH